MTSDSQTRGGGFVIAADEGEAFWFLNTLTINKVGCGDTDGRLCIVDHRVPPGFAPPTGRNPGAASWSYDAVKEAPT